MGTRYLDKLRGVLSSLGKISTIYKEYRKYSLINDATPTALNTEQYNIIKKFHT